MGVGSRWVPGPSDYWMNGFIEIDAGKAEYLIEKYNMKPLNEDLQLALYQKIITAQYPNGFTAKSLMTS